MLRPVAWAGALLTLVLVAACDEDADPAGGPAETPAPVVAGTAPAPESTAAAQPDAVGGACDLLTLTEAGDLFGQSATLDGDDPTTATSQCVWLGENPGLHQLHLQIYAGESFFDPARWAGTPEPVSGLGDEAFLIRSSPLGTTAGYRLGEQVVFLNYQILLSPDADPSASADQLLDLLRQVSERIDEGTGG